MAGSGSSDPFEDDDEAESTSFKTVNALTLARMQLGDAEKESGEDAEGEESENDQEEEESGDEDGLAGGGEVEAATTQPKTNGNKRAR